MSAIVTKIGQKRDCNWNDIQILILHANMARMMKQAQGTRLIRFEGVKLVCPKCKDMLFLKERSKHVFYCPSCLVPMKEE
jgi:hypothetical protein